MLRPLNAPAGGKGSISDILGKIVREANVKHG
jgi:hypothetical protein